MKPPPKLDPYGFCYYQQLIAVKCGDKTGWFIGGHYDRGDKFPDSDLWVMCACDECKQNNTIRILCRHWDKHAGRASAKKWVESIKISKGHNGHKAKKIGRNLYSWIAAQCRELGHGVVGHKLRVWWPGAKLYYHGTVQSFDDQTFEHHIRYKDGTEEDLWLAVESYEDLGMDPHWQPPRKAPQGHITVQPFRPQASLTSPHSQQQQKSPTVPGHAAVELQAQTTGLLPPSAPQKLAAVSPSTSFHGDGGAQQPQGNDQAAHSSDGLTQATEQPTTHMASMRPVKYYSKQQAISFLHQRHNALRGTAPPNPSSAAPVSTGLATSPDPGLMTSPATGSTSASGSHSHAHSQKLSQAWARMACRTAGHKAPVQPSAVHTVAATQVSGPEQTPTAVDSHIQGEEQSPGDPAGAEQWVDQAPPAEQPSSDLTAKPTNRPAQTAQHARLSAAVLDSAALKAAAQSASGVVTASQPGKQSSRSVAAARQAAPQTAQHVEQVATLSPRSGQAANSLGQAARQAPGNAAIPRQSIDQVRVQAVRQLARQSAERAAMARELLSSAQAAQPSEQVGRQWSRTGVPGKQSAGSAQAAQPIEQVVRSSADNAAVVGQPSGQAQAALSVHSAAGHFTANAAGGRQPLGQAQAAQSLKSAAVLSSSSPATAGQVSSPPTTHLSPAPEHTAGKSTGIAVGAGRSVDQAQMAQSAQQLQGLKSAAAALRTPSAGHFRPDRQLADGRTEPRVPKSTTHVPALSEQLMFSKAALPQPSEPSLLVVTDAKRGAAAPSGVPHISPAASISHASSPKASVPEAQAAALPGLPPAPAESLPGAPSPCGPHHRPETGLPLGLSPMQSPPLPGLPSQYRPEEAPGLGSAPRPPSFVLEAPSWRHQAAGASALQPQPMEAEQLLTGQQQGAADQSVDVASGPSAVHTVSRKRPRQSAADKTLEDWLEDFDEERIPNLDPDQMYKRVRSVLLFVRSINSTASSFASTLAAKYRSMVDQTKKSEMITNLFQGCSEVLADAQDAGLDMDQVKQDLHNYFNTFLAP